MPFIHPHLALMPDAHLGKGATAGSVIPTLGGGPAYNDPDTAQHFAVRFFRLPIQYHPNGSYRWGECHADVLLELASD